MRTVVGVLVALVLLAGPVAANAQVDPPAPACPAAPDLAYTGADDAAHETRELRRELAGVCAVLVDKLKGVDQVHDDVRPLAGALATLSHDVAGLGATDAAALHVTSADPQSGTQTVALANADRAVITDQGDRMHQDLWFAIGTGVMLVGGVLLIRSVLL